jgi:hypothetical protein
VPMVLVLMRLFFPHGDNAKNSSTWTSRNAGDETSGDNR